MDENRRDEPVDFLQKELATAERQIEALVLSAVMKKNAGLRPAFFI